MQVEDRRAATGAREHLLAPVEDLVGTFHEHLGPVGELPGCAAHERGRYPQPPSEFLGIEGGRRLRVTEELDVDLGLGLGRPVLEGLPDQDVRGVLRDR